MPGGGGSSGGGTSINVTEPPAWQVPFLKKGLERGEELYQQGAPNYYPGSTTVPFAPQSELALNLTEDRALGGSPLLKTGQDELQKTIRGDYLGQGNPYLSAMTERLRNQIQPAIDSRFAMSRGFGSNAHQETMARAMADATAPYLFNAYESERGRQAGAVPQSIGMSQADYADLDRLRGVGGEREAQAETEVASAIDRHNFNQLRPETNMRRYMDLVRGQYGGTEQMTQPHFRNRGAGILGGGLLGSMLAKDLKISPWLGAAGGGLLGGFF